MSVSVPTLISIRIDIRTYLIRKYRITFMYVKESRQVTVPYLRYCWGTFVRMDCGSLWVCTKDERFFFIYLFGPEESLYRPDPDPVLYIFSSDVLEYHGLSVLYDFIIITTTSYSFPVSPVRLSRGLQVSTLLK